MEDGQAEEGRRSAGTLCEIVILYESNDQKPIGTQGGSEFENTAAMVSRSVYSNTTCIHAIKKTTSQITAARSANYHRTLCY